MKSHDDDPQRQLELATSVDPIPDDVPLDEETRALRASWLALSQLLDQADAGPSDDIDETVVSVREGAKSRSRWPLVWVAIAASLLLMVSSGWLLVRFGSPIRQSSPADEVAESPDRSDPFPVVASQSKVETNDDEEFSWDDSWDDQIAQVEENVILAGQDWYALDQPYDSMSRQIEQFEGELDDDFQDASL